MDLKQLESFVRVAELGSFTRAAIALGVQQPLLSRHVRAEPYDSGPYAQTQKPQSDTGRTR